MFIGHLALAFGAKKVTPRVSLAVLALAAQWADTIWPMFVAVGIEEVRIDPGNTAFTPLDFVSYPYSHSLVTLLAWGVVVGLVYRGVAGGRRSFWMLSALVVSHWLLDFVSHRADMPLYPGGPKYGLALWNSIPATIAVEAAIFAIGVRLYAQATRPRDGIGRWGFVAFVGVLVFFYAANLVGGAPPTVTYIWSGAIVGAAVLTALAWWIDRHRDIVM